MKKKIGDYNAAAKLKLMRIDLDLLEIIRRIEDIPSEYCLGRRMLDEARPLVRIQLKKAMRKIGKAKKLFLAESVPAAEYNRMKEEILAISPSIPGLVDEYHSCLNNGDYKGASKVLKEIRERPVYAECLQNVMISTASEGPAGEYEVTVSNRTPADSEFVSAYGKTDYGTVDMHLIAGDRGVRSKSNIVVRLKSANNESVKSIEINYRSNGTERCRTIAVRGVHND